MLNRADNQRFFGIFPIQVEDLKIVSQISNPRIAETKQSSWAAKFSRDGASLMQI